MKIRDIRHIGIGDELARRLRFVVAASLLLLLIVLVFREYGIIQKPRDSDQFVFSRNLSLVTKTGDVSFGEWKGLLCEWMEKEDWSSLVRVSIEPECTAIDLNRLIWELMACGFMEIEIFTQGAGSMSIYAMNSKVYSDLMLLTKDELERLNHGKDGAIFTVSGERFKRIVTLGDGIDESRLAPGDLVFLFYAREVSTREIALKANKIFLITGNYPVIQVD